MTTTFEIDTNFPGGNVCEIEVRTSPDKTRIAFAPDPHGGPETLWFYFRVLRAGGDVPNKIELELKHSYNMLGGSQPQNLRPVIRYAQGDWQRLGKPRIEEMPDGRARVFWNIDAPQSSVEIAVCFPYGQSELETLLHETGDYWKRDVIGVGQRGNPLARLSNDYGELQSERAGLYVLARQHAGETPGSWVLDGFLRRMQKVEDAPLVWAVPIADPDGVHFGDYGKDQFPYDLNRAWGAPPMRHETLVIRRDVNRWMQRCRPLLALDFHAPGACEFEGIYSFLPATEKSSEHSPFLHQCTEAMRDALTPAFATSNFRRIAKYRSRWETPNFTRFMATEHDIPALSLETPYSLCGEKVLIREGYQLAGERIADAVMNVIDK